MADRGRCSKGKPCSAACINRNLFCKAGLPDFLSKGLTAVRNEVESKGKDVADHLGKNVAAWKTGKVLGGLVSSYLEGRYGIPRESSVKLAETAIQALAATGLDAKHLKNTDEFSKKLFAELAAAFIGKTSHAGAELFISAKEVSTIVETSLPILAGKVSGIGTSLLANRLPTPSELLTIVQERSRADMEKVQGFLRPYVSFAESLNEMDKVAEVLGDVTLLALLGVKSKIDNSNKSNGKLQ